MGFLMDAIADRYRRGDLPTREQFAANLEPLRRSCHWTEGDWQFGKRIRRHWNDIQNTPKDIEVLVDYLLNEYRKRVWSRSSHLSQAANE